MSNEELQRTLEAIRSVTQEAMTSREKALALLAKVGITTPEGELTEHYRRGA